MTGVVKVTAGVCGMHSEIRAEALEPYGPARLEITSDCKHIQKLAAELPEVKSMEEISFRKEGPVTLRAAARCLPHPACPVPCGIIKAIEVASGLALPQNATIEVAKE